MMAEQDPLSPPEVAERGSIPVYLSAELRAEVERFASRGKWKSRNAAIVALIRFALIEARKREKSPRR